MGFRPQIVNVIGSGFAGIECALFLAGHGIKVHLFNSEKEKRDDFSKYAEEIEFYTSKKRKIFEKVLLKELEMLGSPLVRFAMGQGTDIEYKNYENLLAYGKYMVKNNANIQIFPISIYQINPNEITVVATGNHTDERLMDFLQNFLEGMNCFKRIGVFPVFQDVNEEKMYKKSDSENIFYVPLNYEKYIRFINTIKYYSNNAPEDFVFEEKTMEWLVEKGKDDLRNFAMRQVYIEGYNERPYAVLRVKKTEQGYTIEDVFSKFDKETQEDIFRCFEAFKDAKFVRKADIANICLLNSKFIINEFAQSIKNPHLFFAGSILGVDGAIDNIASGLATAIHINKYFNDYVIEKLPDKTCIGAIMKGLTSVDDLKAKFKYDDYGFLDKVQSIEEENIVEKLFEKSRVNLEEFKERYKHGKRI